MCIRDRTSTRRRTRLHRSTTSAVPLLRRRPSPASQRRGPRSATTMPNSALTPSVADSRGSACSRTRCGKGRETIRPAVARGDVRHHQQPLSLHCSLFFAFIIHSPAVSGLSAGPDPFTPRCLHWQTLPRRLGGRYLCHSGHQVRQTLFSRPSGFASGERYDDRHLWPCLLYTSPSPRDLSTSRMPSSA